MAIFLNLFGIVMVPVALVLVALFFGWLCGQAYENTTGGNQ